MKRIHFNDIVEKVSNMCIEANCRLGDDVLAAFDRALEMETSPLGIEVLQQLKENARIAAEEMVPLCQDTGMAVFFIEFGQDIFISGGVLSDAINEGVRQGYKKGYLRASMLSDPLGRKNTWDNTPAIIHQEIFHGDELKITLHVTGGGCENMSAIKMLLPADGVEGVKDFVLKVVGEVGANACPPIVVGLGIGGNFEMSALLAKKALLRPIGNPHSRMDLAALEEELLRKINCLGIGPSGLGGKVTALAVHIEVFPCHIATLPVAINIGCHACRNKTMVM